MQASSSKVEVALPVTEGASAQIAGESGQPTAPNDTATREDALKTLKGFGSAA
jgi:hypothetical protein